MMEPAPAFKHIEWCDSQGSYLDEACSCPGREDADLEQHSVMADAMRDLVGSDATADLGEPEGHHYLASTLFTAMLLEAIEKRGWTMTRQEEMVLRDEMGRPAPPGPDEGTMWLEGDLGY